ncbi:MAG: hypothetical protein KBA72_08725 [Thermoanaerobaculia bacterium]|nr:hypothetical protein [Thermoanaerobaculia bacterium]
MSDEATLLRLLRQEEHRVLSSAALAADPARLAAGWERRFLADGPRAAEAVALYESLGFEVAADPLAGPDLPTDCTDCQLATLLAFKTIYTRKPKENDR